MPEIRVLRPQDQTALEDFLGPRMDSSILLLSNSRRAGLEDRGGRFEGTYVGAFEGGRMVGVVAHYWLKNLVLQTPPEHLPALLDAVVAAGARPIGGLLGPSAQVARAVEVLGLADAALQFDEQEGLYALELAALAVPPALDAGRLRGRRIERRDLDQATAWRVAYTVEALNDDDTPELRDRCRADMESSLERGDTWVLDDDGRLVAMTSFNAALAEVVQVGGVWTPPELRGRGYGRGVVAASLLDARAEGVGRGVLFTGDGNAPAIRAYLALGFRLVGDYRLVLLGEGRDAKETPTDADPK